MSDTSTPLFVFRPGFAALIEIASLNFRVKVHVFWSLIVTLCTSTIPIYAMGGILNMGTYGSAVWSIQPNGVPMFFDCNAGHYNPCTY